MSAWFAPRKNKPPGAAKALGRISFNGAQDTVRQLASANHACSSNRKKQDELIAQMLAIIAADTVPERPGRSADCKRRRCSLLGKRVPRYPEKRNHMGNPIWRSVWEG
jgi:hypothetical protein